MRWGRHWQGMWTGLQCLGGRNVTLANPKSWKASRADCWATCEQRSQARGRMFDLVHVTLKEKKPLFSIGRFTWKPGFLACPGCCEAAWPHGKSLPLPEPHSLLLVVVGSPVGMWVTSFSMERSQIQSPFLSLVPSDLCCPLLPCPQPSTWASTA